MRLLLVEDDTELAGLLKADLERAGYAVDHADNGVDGEHLGREEPYDAAVLDLGLPQRPGLEVLRHWRSAPQGNACRDLPVLILTARDAWQDKVEGFKAGADDYLAKPFHPQELQVRLAALIRRAAGRAQAQLEVAGLRLDDARQCVILADGDTVDLTATEFRLLRYLLHHPGEVLSRSRLAEHIYDFDDERDSNVIEVYIRRLRAKFGRDLIETRRGQGYVLRPDQVAGTRSG